MATKHLNIPRPPSHWNALWYLAIGVLLFTAGLKSHWVIASHSKLTFLDPVLAPLTVKHVAILGIVSELAVVAMLLLFRSDHLRAIAVLWWSILVLSYRHWFPKSQGEYCPCFGNLPEMLGLTSNAGALAARIIIQIFVAGALLVLLWGPIKRLVRSFPPVSSKSGPLSLWIFLAFAGCPVKAAEKSWEISGLLSRSNLSPGENKVVTETGWFVFLRNSNSVNLTVSITNNPYNTSPNTLHYEYRTDGAQAVSFGRFDTNIVFPDDYIYPTKVDGKWMRTTNAVPRKPENTAHAFTSPNALPHGYTAHAIPLMLAFGWDLTGPLFTSKKAPHLTDNEQFQRGDVMTAPYQAQTNFNYTFRGLATLSSTYKDTKFTNDFFIAEGSLPSSLGRFPSTLLYRHLLTPEAVSALKVSTNLDLEVAVTITNISHKEEAPLGCLDFADVTMVDDRRFSLKSSDWIPSVMYTSTNGSIPTIQRLKTQSFYQSAVRQHASSARQNKKRRLFFIGFALFPAILLGWWVIKQKPKTSNL